MGPVGDAYLDERVSYDSRRKFMLMRFANTENPQIAERMAKAALLLAAEGDELKAAEQLSERTLQRVPHDASSKCFLFCGALASYRTGDWTAAADRAERSIQLAGDGPPSLLALDYAVLAWLATG